MHLNPTIYQKVIRPKFAIKKYIQKIIQADFNFDNSQILDFGCGTGSNAFIFKPQNYLGVDVDEKRLDFARKLFPKYKFQSIQNGILPAADKTFDYICILATIHHIPDHVFQAYIKEFTRVLKDTGSIVIIEPVLSDKHKFNSWFMKTFDDGNYIRFEKDYLKLFDTNFRVNVHKRFRKFFFYNELFFSAKKR